MKLLPVLALALVVGCSASHGPPHPNTPNEIDAKKVNRQREAAHVAEVIQGNIPGVAVGVGPDGRMKLRVRGSLQDPLCVVDGMALLVCDLAFLNPYDITTIRALKGADATIWGARGAHGVITVIPTRSTSADVSTVWCFSCTSSTSTPSGV